MRNTSASQYGVVTGKPTADLLAEVKPTRPSRLDTRSRMHSADSSATELFHRFVIEFFPERASQRRSRRQSCWGAGAVMLCPD